jgi:hypothetical protein
MGTQYENNNKIVKCHECGEQFHSRVLSKHLKSKHSYERDDFIEYHFKYHRKEDEGICKCVGCEDRTSIVPSSTGLKIRYGKFCESHKYCSRLSPVNTKYWIDIFGCSEEEAKKNTKEPIEKSAKGVREGIGKTFFIPSQLEYWLKKTNGDEEEAKRLQSKQQVTFSKDICIEKYGKKKGIEIWKKRQERWLDTLDEKSDEEKLEIRRLKAKGLVNRNCRNYSKISQELFIEVYNQLNWDIDDIFFATLCRDGKILDDGTNKEYIFKTEVSYRLIDFYIPSLNCSIEYDGDWWHNNNFYKGNVERDRIREKELLNSGMKILHIKECDYKSNKEKTINKCVDFIMSEAKSKTQKKDYK